MNDWEDRANCLGTDPDLFFPDRGNTPGIRRAKAVCAECPVKTDCLEYALDFPERFGIWGGLTSRERWKLRADLMGRRANRARCGTRSGAQRHRALGEVLCEACVMAERVHGRRRVRVS